MFNGKANHDPEPSRVRARWEGDLDDPQLPGWAEFDAARRRFFERVFGPQDPGLRDLPSGSGRGSGGREGER